MEKLREYAQGRISHFKVPKFVRFVDTFPLTVTGKVKKNVMRDVSNEIFNGDPKLNDHFFLSAKKPKEWMNPHLELINYIFKLI